MATFTKSTKTWFILFSEFLSHPDKQYVDHIGTMIDEDDTALCKAVKSYHDIAKLKNNFQLYIRDTTKYVSDKNHSLLSGYLFLLNHDFKEKEMLFGFLSIVSHHDNVEDFFELNEPNKYVGKYCTNSKELSFLDEVVENAKQIELYKEVVGSTASLEAKVLRYQKYLRRAKSFTYEDYIKFRALYASLVYSDKYEAIFGIKKEQKRPADMTLLQGYIENLSYSKKRDEFRKYVLNHFDTSHKLFTLTAPTGYGKTLTALQFAIQFQKEKVIFALPFTSIIDQTEQIISDIFAASEISIYKVHHKSTIDERVPDDRYSQVKFLMNTFSGEINVTTLYQVVFALFGNKNKDNVKFNQFKNSVVIIDEAQAIPYAFRKDFMRLCKLISETMGTVFIFMSATMPIVEGGDFKEISNLDYFKKQNRYLLQWLPLDNGEVTLKDKVASQARQKHTLCVVNTVKKAQELYMYFSKNFECYCLNGYMTDSDKQRTVSIVQARLKQGESKILLISTQSIEAGIDLDFEVGFREIAPISSIIQTAGRVNRHFGENQGVLYIFDDICGHSDLIYGDLQQISQSIFEILKEKPVQECDILKVSQLYFEKINKQLERYFVENEIKRLEFKTIHEKIEAIVDGKDFKQLVIIEPFDGFIKEIEGELLNVRNATNDKFRQKDLIDGVVRKLLQFGVNVSKNDIENFATETKNINCLFEMPYLPFGSREYSSCVGIKKSNIVQEEDCFS